MVSQETLKNDLLTLDEKSFFIKYIAKSHNWYICDYLKAPENEVSDRLDRVKEIISSNMGVGFHSTQIVGSAKIGYSISPRPDTLLCPFNDDSDIDLAIVSAKMYEYTWDKLRECYKYRFKELYDTIAMSVYRGYIDTKNVKKIELVRKIWEEKEGPTNAQLQDELRFIHPITYRIYRSWEDLQEYQLSGIKSTRYKLGRTNG